MSCGETKEEITINNDGSGTYEVSADVIPMIRSMMQSFAQFGMEEGEEVDSAKLAAKVEEMVWKDFPGEVDSTLSVDPEVLETYKDDPEKLALINQTTMYMKGGRDKGYVKTGLLFHFKNPEELELFTQMMEESSDDNEKTKLFSHTNTTLKLTKNSFYRSSMQTKPLESDSAVAALDALFEDATIITQINFPKKIKKVKVKTYEILKQGDKSLVLKFDPAKAIKEGKSEIKVDF